MSEKEDQSKMTKKDLIDRTKYFSDDDVIIISDGKGWRNIEKVEKQGHNIVLLQEKYPVFSDN